MPCPYFQPLRPVERPRYSNARLPLLREFDGLCCAGTTPEIAPEEMRFGSCNQGNSTSRCARYPVGQPLAVLRYSVVRMTSSALELLMLEERDYTPFTWQELKYYPDSDKLEPEARDASRRAQIVAFCRSFMEQSEINIDHAE